jgi:hypothetical protein
MLCPACAPASQTSSPAWRPCCSAGRHSSCRSTTRSQARALCHTQQHVSCRERGVQCHLACTQQLGTLACQEEQRDAAVQSSSGAIFGQQRLPTECLIPARSAYYALGKHSLRVGSQSNGVVAGLFTSVYACVPPGCLSVAELIMPPGRRFWSFLLKL